MVRIKIVFMLVFFSTILKSQTSFSIKGHLPEAGSKKIELVGFDGILNMLIDETQCDSLGNFKLIYNSSYVGAAMLVIDNAATVPILLNSESFTVECKDLGKLNALEISKSKENAALLKAEKILALSGRRINDLRLLDPLSGYYNAVHTQIGREEIAQNANFLKLLKKLSSDSYASIYLDLHRLIFSMPALKAVTINELSLIENNIKKIDFSSHELYTSGLIKELISSYCGVVKNTLDKNSAEKHAAEISAYILESTSGNDILKSNVASYLFDQLEYKGLVKAAEYVALAMLNDTCAPQSGAENQAYEQYRAMAVGKKAPLIDLSNKDVVMEFSGIQQRLKLVVFGASWCSFCVQKVEELKNKYPYWKKMYDLQIIYISLDTDAESHRAFTDGFPWITSCDYKGFKGENALSYYVYGIPLMYLLDADNAIVLKPAEVSQLEQWLAEKGK